MSYIIDFLGAFFTNLYNFGKWIFDSLSNALLYILYQVVDLFCSAIEGLINLVDFPSLAFSQAAMWANVDPNAIYIIDQLMIPECCAMIATAYAVRFTLNLIPSWATRI